MHLIFFLEEPSAEEFMNALLPKVLGENHTFELHAFAGKPDLLKKLPSRLKPTRNGSRTITASWLSWTETARTAGY